MTCLGSFVHEGTLVRIEGDVLWEHSISSPKLTLSVRATTYRSKLSRPPNL